MATRFERLRYPVLPRCQPLGNRAVYAIAGGRLVKIGQSFDVEKRLASLQIGAPDKLILLGSVTNVQKRLESDIHHYLRDYCQHGEWFELRGEAKRVVDLIVARNAFALYELVTVPRLFARGPRDRSWSRHGRPRSTAGRNGE